MRVIQTKLLLLLFIAWQFAEAQKYCTNTYTEADGLANSTVYDVAQDSNGLMWFATRAGISSYNGSKWKSYTVKDGLLMPSYEKLFVDGKGWLWAFTASDGICVSLFKDGYWEKKFCDDSISISRPITAFLINNTNEGVRVYVGTYTKGLWVYQNDSWFNYTMQDGLLSNQVNGAAFFKDTVYIATPKGFSVLRNNTIDNSLNDQLKLPSPNILGLYIENGKNDKLPVVWMLGKDWLAYTMRSEVKIISRDFTIMTDNKYFNALLLRDDYDDLYFGNVFYLFHYEPVEDKLKRIGIVNGLISEGATAIMQDREHNIWITGLRGITKMSPKRFESYNKEDGLFQNEVTSIEKIKPGHYVLGHHGGLSFWDGINFKTYDLETSDTNLLHEIRVQDIAVDNEENIWIAASLKGLAKLDKKGDITWYHDKQGLKGSIMSVIADENNNILVCSEKGLFKLIGNRFEPVNRVNKVTKNQRKIFKAKDNTLYIGTYSHGLLEITDETVNLFKCKEKNCSNNVYAFLEDSKGRKWIGTWNGLYTLRNDTLQKVKNKNLKIDRPVYLIIEDHENNIWLGCDNGLYCYDGNYLKHYTMSDGLAGMEINRDAGMVEKETIWIGTSNGFSIYNPRYEFDLEEYPPPVVKLNTLRVGEDTLSVENEIELPANKNNFCFTFNGISFLDEDKVYFRCKLEGFDKEWREEFRSVDNKYCYFNLPPGKYKFCIKARNKIGLWSEPVCSSVIVINQPFWLRWWFITILGALLLFGIYFFLRIIFRLRYSGKLKEQVEERTLELKKSEQKLKELNDTKDRFFSIIAHDLKSPFNAILGLSDVLKSEFEALSKEDMKGIVQNLHLASSRSVDLLDNLLNWARTQKGNIPFHPDYFDLSLLIEENISIFAPTAENKEVDLINLIRDDTKVFADRDMINTVIRNLISNAIKFSWHGGRIAVSSRINKNYVEVCVRDNGTGIDDESAEKLFRIEEKINTKGTDNEGGTGLGLILCKDFVTKNKGEIWVKSEKGKGSRFCFKLPCNQETSN